jgi:hypothetical protein
MSQLPVAQDPSTCEPQGWKLLKSMSARVISTVSDALMVVQIVFIVVCLLALNVNVITPDPSLAIPSVHTPDRSSPWGRFDPGDDARPPEIAR